MKNLKQKIMSLGLALSFIATSTISSFAMQDMKIEFINVGDGDAIYIETSSGEDILIDAGSTSNGKKVVDQLLKQEKNMDLEYVISTHSDPNHAGGLQEVFKRMNVKKFYYPKDIPYNSKTAKAVLDLAKKEKNCKIYDAKSGIKINSGGAILEFVHSSKNYSTDDEDSVMTYIDYGNLEVLLTSDAEKGAESAGKKYNVDILQVPYHGSKSSSGSSFISKYDPEKIVVSTDGKSFGHPNKETFQRYANYDKNIDVYRTDKTSNIVIKANGSKWWVDKNDTPVKVTKYAGTYTSSGNTSQVFTYSEIPKHIKDKMSGNSLPQNANISFNDLSYLQITYYGFDNKTHIGEMVVNKKIAKEVIDIFKELYEKKYPIDKMKLIDEYNANDDLSMKNNNSSSFCYRKVAGSNNLSNHAKGLAIDINPVQNPYIRGSKISPIEGKAYTNRRNIRKGMIVKNDACYNAFSKRGWTWGGIWNNKDYQHFQKSI